MIPTLCRSLAAALLAAPLGWILSGILTALALDHYPATMHRPLYVGGDHLTGAAVAATIAGLAALLAQAARKKSV